MRIKILSKILSLFSLCTLLLSLTACGGGGGGGDDEETTTTAQAQKLTVTLSLQGNAATIVGAVDLDIVLPDGFELTVDSSTGQPIATDLILLVPGATFASNYIPATATANGLIKAGFFRTDGFAGNASLMQMTCTYAAGATLPTANDFIMTIVASDLNGATLTDITGQMSISTQAVP